MQIQANIDKYVANIQFPYHFHSSSQSHETWNDQRSGSSHQAFHPNAPFFTMGVIKPTELLSFFEKKQENKFIWVILVNILNFCNEKVILIDFDIKVVDKLVPYYQQLNRVFWEVSLTKKVTYWNKNTKSLSTTDTRG